MSPSAPSGESDLTRIVDLSEPLSARTPVYPGDPEFSSSIHSTIAANGFNLLALRLGSQTGTHVDAPYHFQEGGKRIDELPLDRFLGPGIVIDCSGLAERTPIDVAHVAPALQSMRSGVIVLLRTGWSRHFGTELMTEHPYLAADACQAMLERGVRTIGLDAMNIDETPDDAHPGEGFPCHHLIAAADGVIIENLRNLAAIDFERPMVSVLPLLIPGADGAPVRAVAWPG